MHEFQKDEQQAAREFSARVDRITSHQKSMTMPAHEAMKVAKIVRWALWASMKPFAWYDVFNDHIYRNEAEAKKAEAGGNTIFPLYKKEEA